LGDGRWNYPAGATAVLYMSLTRWANRQYTIKEEDQELYKAIGNQVPSIYLGTDVSGRAPGDSELPFIVRILI
jgi:hypothetical protein